MENSNDRKRNLSQANEFTENTLNEPETIYETQQMTDFVFTQEIIDQANEAIRRLDSGEDKGHTVEEMMDWTKDLFKSRHNIDYDYHKHKSQI